MEQKILNITWMPIGDKEMALNQATGDWLLVDSEGKDLFLAAAEGKNPEELSEEFPDFSEEDIFELLNGIKSMDFFSVKDSGPAHYCTDCHKGKFPRLAVLNLTEDCNFKCTYCYVGAGEGQKAKMKPETAFRIVDEYLAMNTNPEDGKINIIMHGGEPLMNYDVVEKLTKYVKPYRDRINLSIQTNASLLTEERVNYLLANEVSIGISLDGPPEIHNLTRPLRSGAGSFDQVMRGIRLLQSHGLHVGVISVMTRKFAEQIDYVLDFFLENEIYNLSFSPFLKIGRGANDNDNFVTPDLIFEAYKHLLDRIIAFNTQPDRPCDLSENILTRMARKIFSNMNEFMCTRAPCGSGRDILGFGMNGDFYACDDFINDPNFWIGSLELGSVKEQLLKTDVVRTRCNRSMAELPRCRECIWRSLCGGICHSADYYSGANGIEETAMCGFYKKLIPYLIETYERVPELPVLLGAQPKNQAKRTLFFALSEDVDPEEQMNGEDFSDLLRFHGVDERDTLIFCGDEPTKIQRFPEFLGEAAKLPAKMILATNGFAFAEENSAGELFRNGLQGVLIHVPESPDEREKLYQALDSYFRIRKETADTGSYLILRVKARLMDDGILPVLKELRDGDQLIVIGTNPKKVMTFDISPLMRMLMKLCASGIARYEAETSVKPDKKNTSGRVKTSFDTPEQLIWIDSDNYAGRKLEEFPADLYVHEQFTDCSFLKT